MAKSKYIDRDNLYSDRMDSGGEEFMGGQAEPAGGIAGLPPEIAAAIAQLMSAQAAGAPAKVAPGMVAGEAAGIPELLAQSDTVGSAATGALPDEVAPAIAAGQGAGIAELLAQSAAPAKAAPAAPVAAYQAPTARESRDGVGKDGQVAALSQTQGYGMVPVYEAQQGRGADRGEPVLMGYEFNPIAAGLTTVDTPKPAAILAEEKRLGKEMEPTYATYTAPRGQGGESVAYGPPTGYRYDNGESQYVKFDASGNYYETEKRKSGSEDALKMAALFAAIASGGASLGLGAGAGAGAAGAGAAGTAAFSPQMIAAGMAPGAAGATGAVSGALTGANLAAASGVGSLGAGAAGAGVAGLGSSTPITETAAEVLSNTASGAGGYGSGGANPSLLSSAGAGEAGITSLAAPITETAAEVLGTTASGTGGYGTGSSLLGAEGTTAALGSGAAETGVAGLGGGAAPSLNQLVASGMSPGSLGALNAAALTPEALAAASGVTTAGATPALVELGRAGKGLTSANEMIASGTGAGSAGAAGAASGALTPAELAAASGVVTEGATPALFEAGRAGKGLTSANEAVASGLGPGSAGAKAAVDGTLTAQELAAAAGTTVIAKDGTGDLLTKVKDVITDKAKDASSGSSSGMGLGGALGLMALMSMMNKGGGAAPASTATIPELTATRSQLPYDVDKKGVNPNTPYRPGQGGVTYFSPTTYTPTPPKAAGGGLMSLGQSNLGGYSDGGRLLKGPGDGVSDSIPAIIGRKQPARLANGEFVIPARIVSELGNGSTDAGAKRLYEMMARVQKARRNTKNVAANTKAAKYLPA